MSTLRRIGPGMVLAASIVGSGELIATTTLGAQAGYTALWVVLLSCSDQAGDPGGAGTLHDRDRQDRPRGAERAAGPAAARVNWLVWAWAVMVAGTQLQVGAMYGGVSQVMHLVVPAVPVTAWVLVFLAITLALLLGGGYERVERIAMVKVALFTLLTALAALVLMRMPRFFPGARSPTACSSSCRPRASVWRSRSSASPGVGATELFMYPYWCVEKGYAQFTGPARRQPRRGSAARAAGSA